MFEITEQLCNYLAISVDFELISVKISSVEIIINITKGGKKLKSITKMI